MDWRSISNEREKYAAYLCSREWSEKKEAVRRRAGGKCELCRCYQMDACHHLTYLRKYRERIEDLQAICSGCHEFTHGKRNEDPAKAADIVRTMRKHGISIEALTDAWQVLNTDIGALLP